MTTRIYHKSLMQGEHHLPKEPSGAKKNCIQKMFSRRPAKRAEELGYSAPQSRIHLGRSRAAGYTTSFLVNPPPQTLIFDVLNPQNQEHVASHRAYGMMPIKVTFFENFGRAVLKLRYKNPAGSPQLIPASKLFHIDPDR